jgi:hypothetical protein
MCIPASIVNRALQRGRSGMTSRNRVLTPHERRRDVAAILAIAVRRFVQDQANSTILSTDGSNRVELVLEKRLSVSRVRDASGMA